MVSLQYESACACLSGSFVQTFESRSHRHTAFPPYACACGGSGPSGCRCCNRRRCMTTLSSLLHGWQRLSYAPKCHSHLHYDCYWGHHCNRFCLVPGCPSLKLGWTRQALGSIGWYPELVLDADCGHGHQYYDSHCRSNSLREHSACSNVL